MLKTGAIKTGSDQFKEALGCCVVVSPLIGQVLHAHFVYTLVHKGHETADGLAHIRLCVYVRACVTLKDRDQHIYYYYLYILVLTAEPLVLYKRSS